MHDSVPNARYSSVCNVLRQWSISLIPNYRVYRLYDYHRVDIIESVESIIIESVDSISRDELDAPLTQYITNAGISRVRYTIMHFKHHHRVLRLISNRMSSIRSLYSAILRTRCAK